MVPIPPFEAAAVEDPATVTVPVMPAAAWPGMEHWNEMPAAGTVTVPVTV